MDAWTSRPVLTCRSCSTELPSDAKFCWQCGISVHLGALSGATQSDETTPVKELHRLLDASRGEKAYSNVKAIKDLVARFPSAVNEPVGKERLTALHVVAYGQADQEVGENRALGHTRSCIVDALFALPELDVHARDWQGNTPLHTAVSCCPQLPLGNQDHGLDFRDPFMLMVQHDVIAGLLNLGADPNAVNHEGKTPVHLAAERGHTHALYNLMCVHGGDPLALDKQRWTAVHYATRNGYTHVLNLINQELEDRAKAGQPAPLPEPFARPTE
jgi:hypothetical protein